MIIIINTINNNRHTYFSRETTLRFNSASFCCSVAMSCCNVATSCFSLATFCRDNTAPSRYSKIMLFTINVRWCCVFDLMCASRSLRGTSPHPYSENGHCTGWRGQLPVWALRSLHCINSLHKYGHSTGSRGQFSLWFLRYLRSIFFCPQLLGRVQGN